MFMNVFYCSIFGLKLVTFRGRREGLMVYMALDFESSGPDSSPCRGHCVVLSGKTLNSHSTSLNLGVPANLMLGGRGGGWK